MANNLSATDTNNTTYIYLWDAWRETNQLVSANSKGIAAGKASSAQVSPDGRFVVFTSSALDLVTPPLTSQYTLYLQLYARDLLARTNFLLSTSESVSPAFGGISTAGNFSANGHWFVFAMALLSSPSSSKIGVYDLWNRSLRRLTIGGANPAICADGSRIAFEQPTTSLSKNLLMVYDLVRNTNVFSTTAGISRNPSLSADGRFLVFESNLKTLVPNNTNSAFQIFIQDLQQNFTALVSVNRQGINGGNSNSFSPFISADGRYVVFQSQASDLVDNDTNGVTDVFVRDVAAGATFAISANLNGTGTGNSLSTMPVMSADGRTVAFTSWASDLVPGDRNNNADVFILRLGSGDSDHDGMDDDWEWTFFGNLDRDGTGDFDGDGMSDLAEFKAGTNPINDSSVLRVLTLTSLETGATRIFWSAMPGKTYSVQFKNALADAEWTNLPGSIVAQATTASQLDDSPRAMAQRFYRVVLIANP